MTIKFFINKFSVIIFWHFATLYCKSAISQDLEPRLLSAIPIGANIAIAPYSHSTGNILVDSGFSTRAGADFNSIVLIYTYIWFDKK